MSERQIKTSPIFPPINIRGLNWCATFDGYEPGCPIGHGETEQEAIDDLRSIVTTHEDHGRDVENYMLKKHPNVI